MSAFNRTMHVAAMPFPTVQGTQASILAMLNALTELERRPHLVTYANAGYPHEPAFSHARIRDFPRDRSLRSGPSWRKVMLDVALVRFVRNEAKRVGPSVVVAHHVEALAACLAARVRPLVYFAHTELGPELPLYLPRWPERTVHAVAERSEQALARRADAIAAISPSLASRLGARGLDALFVPTPWQKRGYARERTAEVREALGIPEDVTVLLYAGNLDPYQGWQDILETLVLLERGAQAAFLLLVATTSDASALRDRANALGVGGRVWIRPLATAADRRRAHAAADIAIVTRRIEGGLPIKLLDALARGVPVVATERATAGLELRGAVEVVPNDSAQALCLGILHTVSRELDDALARERQAERGWMYLERAHLPTHFVESFELVCERARHGTAR